MCPPMFLFFLYIYMINSFLCLRSFSFYLCFFVKHIYRYISIHAYLRYRRYQWYIVLCGTIVDCGLCHLYL